MPPTLERQTATGEKKEFKYIGGKIDIAKSEHLQDKWADIPTPPSMTTEEEKLLTFLDGRLSAAKERHLKRIDVFNASYLQYRSVNYYNKLYGGFPSYWNEWGANVFIPRTFEVVEAARARLKSKDADFIVKPLQKNVKGASKVNIAIHSEWRRSGSHAEVVDALDDAIIFGSGISRNDLIKDIEDQQVLSFDEYGNLKYTPKRVTAYYGVGSRHVDVYDFFPDPSPDAMRVNGRPGARHKGLQYCFVRTIADVEQLRSQYKKLNEEGTYGVTANWQYLKPGGDLNDYKYLRTYIDDLYQVAHDVRYPATLTNLHSMAGAKFDSTGAYQEGKIEVWEYFEKDRYIVFAQGLILRDTPNPYPHKKLPFSKLSLFDTKTFWSIGYPELMRWLQVIENTLYDQGLNNIVMNVHKMFAVNSRYLVDEGELVTRPFGIVHLKPVPGVNIQDAIQPIQFSPLFQDFFNFLSLSKSNIQTLTGQSEFSTGGISKEAKVERATVANRIVQGGLIRVNEIARRYENDLIADAIEQLVEIMQFYYQIDLGGAEGLDFEYNAGSETEYWRFLPKKYEELTPEELKIVGPDGYKGVITIDKIQGKYKVIVQGGSTIALDPDEEANLKMQFANWVAGIVDPEKIVGRDEKGRPIGAPVFDMAKLSMEVAKDVFKIQYPEQFRFKPKEEQEKEQELPSLEEGAIEVPEEKAKTEKLELPKIK